jgi:hypothetical protein
MLGRIGLTPRTSVWVTLELAGRTWLVPLPLPVPAAIAAAMFKYTRVPEIGGNRFLTVFFALALAIALALTWPVRPADEVMDELPLPGRSGSSTRSTGGPRASERLERTPLTRTIRWRGHMGGETELAAHEPWETVGQSPYTDPDDAPAGLDTADDDGW